MIKYLAIALAAAGLAACDARVEVPPSENNTTVVNPPSSEKKVESNTTVVNPPASGTTVEKSTTTTTNQ